MKRLERITAHAAISSVAFAVTGWALYIAIGGLAS